MNRTQKILTTLFIIVGVAAVLFFGMRAARSFMRMRGKGNFGKPPPAKQTDISLIRDWMTIPYVANMYDIPPEALFKSLRTEDDFKNDFGREFDKELSKKSLKELNDELYPEQDEIILNHIRAAIQSMQRQEKPPRFPATPLPPIATSTPTP